MPGRKMYPSTKAYVIRSRCNGCGKEISQQLPPTRQRMVGFYQWRADNKGRCPDCAAAKAAENAKADEDGAAKEVKDQALREIAEDFRASSCSVSPGCAHEGAHPQNFVGGIPQVPIAEPFKPYEPESISPSQNAGQSGSSMPTAGRAGSTTADPR